MSMNENEGAYNIGVKLPANASATEIFIDYALRIGALQLLREPRQLKSGRISPYFFNSGLFDTGQSLSKLMNAYVAAIPDTMLDFDVLYGPPYKGIPLATALAHNLWRELSVDCHYAYHRKEAKDHGEGGTHVGRALNQQRVVLVDDVMTSGASCDEAVGRIQEQDGTLIGCVIAFDRQEYTPDDPVNRLSATQAFTKKHGVPVWSAASLSDLVNLLAEYGDEKNENYPTIMDNLRAYRLQYGAAL